MKLTELHNIFDIKYGNSLELINLIQCAKEDPDSINYVSRTEKNNGISAFVKRNTDFSENPANTISVAVSGSVLSTFLQPEPYYTGFHVFVLSPKREMSQLEMLFYCQCIRANKYKYNYGRQANRTLKDLLVPNQIPSEFKNIEITALVNFKTDSINKRSYDLEIQNWAYFIIGNLFGVKYGVNLELNAMTLNTPKSTMPFVSRTANNNGISAYVEEIEDIEPNPANTISVAGSGSVLECFLQEEPYYSGRDLYYLSPKFQSNKYILLFIITVIRQEKYRFNYGRAANRTLAKLRIKLPTTKKGEPDFDWMEKYMQSLPFSSSLLVNNNKISIEYSAEKLNKASFQQKGLSDEELIKKYEAGKVNMKKAIQPMLIEPKE